MDHAEIDVVRLQALQKVFERRAHVLYVSASEILTVFPGGADVALDIPVTAVVPDAFADDIPGCRVCHPAVENVDPLCGGVVDLMQCGFETLVEAGYAPENAYFECIHEMKLIIDLINKGGVAAMNYSISDTAEFGEYVSGPRVLPHEETKARMRAVLADIQDGTFAGRWIAENKSRGRTFFNSKRDQLAKHPMEQVGEELRRNMIWGGDKDLDTASN